MSLLIPMISLQVHSKNVKTINNKLTCMANYEELKSFYTTQHPCLSVAIFEQFYNTVL